jgi:tetraacyldisaccharide 4'-kinase
MGGTGKTPHAEYLLALLQYSYKVATLSRGYGRKTHGFLVAQQTSTASEIGDEPKQFKSKFPEGVIAVAEDRVLAVPRLLDAHSYVEIILLDDAFQHRSIRAGLSILLTEYAQLFTRDEIFPFGWLREEKSNYHRADIIIVTKCPHNISEEKRKEITDEIKPFRYQKIYFSEIQYAPLYSFYNFQTKAELDKNTDVLLVCGIANYDGLKKYLETKTRKVFVREYKDHHNYDRYDLEMIRDTFTNLGTSKKMLVTTEKDAARFEEHRNWFLQNKIEIFVQPVSVQFIGNDGEKFNADILHYLEATKQTTAKF